MNRRHLYGLVSSLSVVGLFLFAYKVLVLGFPLSPQGKAEIWDVEIRAAFVARGGPTKVRLNIPSNSRTLVVVDESFVSRGYGLTTVKEQGNRQAIWSIRKARGEQALYYRAVVQRVTGREPAGKTRAPSVEPPGLDEPEQAAGRALLAEAREHSADQDTLVAQLFKRLNDTANDNVDVMVGRDDTALRRLIVASQVLALDGIAARVLRGIRLETARIRVSAMHWFQVYDGDRWRSYDPQTGEPGLPEDFLILGRGEGPLLAVDGGDRRATRLSVRRSEEAGVTAAVERGRLLSPDVQAFSMLSLPVATQEVYRVLLLIPVGALLLVLLRNVVGIKTFGTFMPVLIALAFRETQLLAGLVLFTVLVSLGLAVRFYLEHLKLLLVPRLASLLVIVVGIMALVSVVSHRLGIETGLSVALFPMVIITMTIERMSIVWDERGAMEAIHQGAGSLLVASLAYLVMSNGYVSHAVFVFPELLLILLAATLLLGRYTGYRLLELRRFKALAKIQTEAQG